MTSRLSSVFVKSLLVTSIGMGVVACGGGSGLSNGGIIPLNPETPVCPDASNPACDPPPPPVCPDPANPACDPEPVGIEVRDFGGRNGKIVWDANHDAFVVGTDGTLYVYNAAAGTPAADNDFILSDRLAKVTGISITSDNAILRGEDEVGAIAPDQTSGGELFYVLSHGAGTEQGYLDIDYNKNFRNGAADDKTDARIAQIRAVAIQNSFQGFLDNVLWDATDGDVIVGGNLAAIEAVDTDLNFNFAAPTSDNYQFVLREFDHPYTDLDIRLIDTLTGRILASSYGTLSGEVISFPLVAGTSYGVNINRQTGTDDVSFLLSIKQSDDTGEETVELSNLDAAKTVRGTIHPITRFEFCSRFPIPGWADASSDSSSDTSSDSLFLALLESDSSGDASDDASGDAFEDQADTDEFSFLNPNTAFLTDYSYRILNEGGTTLSTVLRTRAGGIVTNTYSAIGEKTFERKHQRNTEMTLQFGEYFNSRVPYEGDTIEYEMIIERQ